MIRKLISTAFLGCMVTLPAIAGSTPDINFLDRLANQRSEESPHAPRTPPIISRHENLRPTERLWVCMSTTPWRPIYASPSPNSTVIGKTQPQVAVSGGWVDGYAMILSYNGKIGYIPANSIRPYRSETGAIATCRVAGTRQGGAPVFAYTSLN